MLKLKAKVEVTWGDIRTH